MSPYWIHYGRNSIGPSNIQLYVRNDTSRMEFKLDQRHKHTILASMPDVLEATTVGPSFNSYIYMVHLIKTVGGHSQA